MPDAHHSMKVAAQRSGLSSHVIRVWERRYGAVDPKRTGTNRRLYSDADIERLRLLREATAAGHAIGNIATLPPAKLRALVAHTDHAPITPAPLADRSLLSEALAAVRHFDSAALENVLGRGLMALGHQGLLKRLVVPLAQQIGAAWEEGDLTAAHEHFASAAVRLFVSNSTRPFAGEENAPRLLVTTPSGQLHELGAVIAGAAAASLGWRVTYLGPSLPAAEIAGAALQNRVRAIALSIVYPADDAALGPELVALRRFVGPDVRIVVGGRAAKGYRAFLDQIQAVRLESVDELYPLLERLRSAP